MFLRRRFDRDHGSRLQRFLSAVCVLRRLTEAALRRLAQKETNQRTPLSTFKICLTYWRNQSFFTVRHSFLRLKLLSCCNRLLAYVGKVISRRGQCLPAFLQTEMCGPNASTHAQLWLTLAALAISLVFSFTEKCLCSCPFIETDIYCMIRCNILTFEFVECKGIWRPLNKANDVLIYDVIFIVANECLPVNSS